MSVSTNAYQAMKESKNVKDYEVQDQLIEEWYAVLIKLELKSAPDKLHVYTLTYSLPDSSELELSIVLGADLKFKRHNWRVH